MTEFKAYIKNTTKDEWLQESSLVHAEHTDDINEAYPFHDKEDLDIALKFLNETFADSYAQHIVGNEPLNAGKIIAGASDGKFQHGDEFEHNNGFVTYTALLKKTEVGFMLVEKELGFPLKLENPKRDWTKVKTQDGVAR